MMIVALGGWSSIAFALIAPLGLLVAAWVGFWLGRRCRRATNESTAHGSSIHESPLDQTPVRTLGAQAFGELETISRQVQTGLATLQSNVLEFKERLAARSRQPASFGERQHSVEAEKMLQPTLDLASQIAQAYDEIRQQTNRLLAISETRTDALTGLSNRHALDESLRNHFAMFSRYDNKFSLVLLDVDQFERLNHQQGSLHGDRVLRRVGSLLGELVRETDLATRYGGDEFVLVLPETNLFGACVLAERLRAAVEQQCGVTVSGGVVEALEDDVPKTLLLRADSALYSAKSSGRNCVFKHDGRQIVAIPVGSYPLPEKFARA
jgi:diguanylate cyclase (GGDEF)-like protein